MAEQEYDSAVSALVSENNITQIHEEMTLNRIREDTEAKSSVPPAPDDDEELVKIKIVGDPPDKKVFNIRRKLVKFHPAICETPGCGTDFFREWLRAQDPKKFPRGLQWEQLTDQLQNALVKKREAHQRTHDRGDYGRVKRSQMPRQWLGQPNPMIRQAK